MKKNLTLTFRFPTELYPKETAILQKAVKKLPNDVIEYFIDNPPMFSAENEEHRANAYTITHDDFKNHKFLIHLNYHIWKYNEEEIIETILHELAHCYLQHKAGDLSYSKNRKHSSKQENEADRLVVKWMRD